MRSIALGACIAMFAGAHATTAVPFDVSSWQDAHATRPAPFFLEFESDGCISRTGMEPCEQAHWTQYLTKHGLERLTAPMGGRSYRSIWFGGIHDGWWQLSVGADGHGWLVASNRKRLAIDAKTVAVFEAALFKSGFASMIADDGSSGLDDCPDNLTEAVVNDRYHFVRRACGAPASIYVADKIIEARAGFKTISPEDEACLYWMCPRLFAEQRAH